MIKNRNKRRYQFSSPKGKLEEPALEFRSPRGAITQSVARLNRIVLKAHRSAVCTSLWRISCCSMNTSNGPSYQCPNVASVTCPVSPFGHLFTVYKLKEQSQPVFKKNRTGKDSQQENKPRHKN